jgi:uroporphyrinogen decarboxylase
MTAVYEEPDSILLLLQKCTSLLKEYIMAFKNSGANGVIMAEPAAGLLSADLCETFSSNFIRTIVSEVQDETFAVMLHNCGNTGQVTQSMFSTGAAMLHFGNNVDMVQTLHEVPDHRMVLGNLDPVSVIKMQRPEEVYASTMNLLTATRGFANYIISTGCDTPPGVPFDNIDAFYKAVTDFNIDRL